MTAEEHAVAVGIVRDNIDELETDEINQLICQNFPRATPFDMSDVWGEYVKWAKVDLARHERETELFEAWDAEQRAQGRPEAELVFGNFVRECGFWVPRNATPEQLAAAAQLSQECLQRWGKERQS
jgi:hypothetical protein